MADISQIQIGSTTYNLKDATARNSIATLTVEPVSTDIGPTSGQWSVDSHHTAEATKTISHTGTYLGIAGLYQQPHPGFAIVSLRGVVNSPNVTFHYHFINVALTTRIWKASESKAHIRSLWLIR